MFTDKEEDSLTHLKTGLFSDQEQCKTFKKVNQNAL